MDDLYQIAVIQGKSASPNRLWMLADMCVEQLQERGISGAVKERSVPGIGRSKKWDVGWPCDGKARLGISLKSLLRNIPGTVPNRVDDLVGEMANVQLLSPEIVTGYIVFFNTGESDLRKDGSRWVDYFREAVGRLSGRDAPAWAPGMMEASLIIEIDFSEQPRLIGSPDVAGFFDRIAHQLRTRNPDDFPPTQETEA